MELLRVAWRTVGSIVTRVNADIDAVLLVVDALGDIGELAPVIVPGIGPVGGPDDVLALYVDADNNPRRANEYRLISDAGMKGVRLPGQKTPEASHSYRAAAKGNRNRANSKLPKKRRHSEINK